MGALIAIKNKSAGPSHAARVAGALRSYLESRLRLLGLAKVSPDWQARSILCERCPMRVVRCGVSYCGNPFLEQVQRDPAVDGCGCPCREKAKSPSEHCPIDSHHRPAAPVSAGCSCKWCRLTTAGVR